MLAFFNIHFMGTGDTAGREDAMKQLLLADPNRDLLRCYAALLGKRGYAVTTAFDGTQDGAFAMAFRGEQLASLIMALTPSGPQTLHISWESIKIAVVPCGTTARAYSLTVIIEHSTWVCESINPGAMYCPDASITRVFSPMQ